MVDYALRHGGGKFIFRCNLDKDANIVNTIKSSVWKNIVYCWCDMNYDDGRLLPTDILWLNSNFQNVIYDKECIAKGLLYVKQMYDGNTILTWENISSTYNKSLNIIHYHNIVLTLSAKYGATESQLMKDNECSKITRIILEKPDDKGIGKRMYKYLVSKKAHYEAIYNKWRHVIEMEDENNALFDHIERVTIVNKLRSFQFKFLHRILYFNDKLFKCKLAPSALCEFCNEAIDSIDHRYFYCNITQGFWKELNHWIQNKYNIDCTINSIHCIITNMYKDMPLIETIMLNAKYYIYSCFLNNTIPHMRLFKYVVIEMEKTERYLAIEKNLLYRHEIKWGKVTTR
jgi:hypothetical protein